MRIASTKPRARISQSDYSLQQRIRYYDKGNDYPQNILRAIRNSYTAGSCVDIYQKFIRGAGLSDPRLLTEKANRKETFSQLHSKLAGDLAIFKGFAVHVAYNAMLQPVYYHHVPFEHCRYEVDSEKLPTGKIAVHPDWTKESGRKFKTSDITYIDPFTLDPADIYAQIEAAGGFDNYKGQLFYFTEEPLGYYPLAHADAVTTQMETQDATANVLFRNARFNFLPSGILTVKKRGVPSGYGDIDNSEGGSAFDNAQAFQGDENALKMLVVEIESDEEKPDYTPFQVQSLEKEYQFTVSECKESIQEFFRIPSELISRKTGAMFSSDAMIQAYDVYNSDTESERMTLEEAYKQLFADKVGYNFNILPKVYIQSSKQAAASAAPIA